MKHSIEKDKIKDMWNVISDSGEVGGVYWMGGLKGNIIKPFNLILMKNDEGMFESLKNISEYIENK